VLIQSDHHADLYTCYSDMAQVAQGDQAVEPLDPLDPLMLKVCGRLKGLIPGGGLILPRSRESAEVQGPTPTPQALTARVLPGL
jgi:hypothetical protein